MAGCVCFWGGDLHFDGTKYRREVRQPRTRKVKRRTQPQDQSRAMDPRSTKSVAPDAQPDMIDPDPKIGCGNPGSSSVNECMAVLERHVAERSRKYPYAKFAGQIFRKNCWRRHRFNNSCAKIAGRIFCKN